jgi:hypothetical protein
MKESTYIVIAETIVTDRFVTVLPLGIQMTFFKLRLLSILRYLQGLCLWCILCLLGKLAIAEVSQSSNL